MDLSYQSLKTKDYGVVTLMISGNVRPNRRKLCPNAILSTTNPASTVMRFEDGCLLSESDAYICDVFHDKYEY
jgi:hypothetical protein